MLNPKQMYVFIIGGSYVGKLYLIYRYTDPEIIPHVHHHRIKIDFRTVDYKFDGMGEDIKTRIFRVNIQHPTKHFLSRIIKLHESFPVAVLCAFDVTRKSSCQPFLAHPEIFKQLNLFKIPFMFIGTKCDSSMPHEMSKQDGELFAESFGSQYTETSALTGLNVKMIIDEIIKSSITSWRYTGEDEVIVEEKRKEPSKCW
ncbi:Small GTPase like protein [Aduncisulcus paluster]|uniref:Small GTPase like protein n=1 Tax=Aduncisulcus paluster TaxID=2918883 RepID=A0ABQ5K600_9EUKA|nr:Small GTPase like protein [Aduncisulcus paluster]